MDLIDLVQWPAMAVTVVAAYLVASSRQGRRNAGFWVFIASNVLWVVWGVHTGAYALIGLQICLAFMNVRGARKAKADAAKAGEQQAPSDPSVHVARPTSR